MSPFRIDLITLKTTHDYRAITVPARFECRSIVVSVLNPMLRGANGGKLSQAMLAPGLILVPLLSYLFLPSEFITKKEGMTRRIGAMSSEVCVLNNPTGSHTPT